MPQLSPTPVLRGTQRATAERHPDPHLLRTAREYWLRRPANTMREGIEVAAVVGAIALGGWFLPVSYHIFGYVYLCAVIALSLRVGRWPVLLAAIISALAWDFVFIPPRLSFSFLDEDDSLMLATYFFAALIVGQLTARLRSQEQSMRLREQRALALLDLSRLLAGAQGFDEAVAIALRQADSWFEGTSALLLPDKEGRLEAHPAGRFSLNPAETRVAREAELAGRPAGRFTPQFPASAGLYLPLSSSGATFGVFAVCLPGMDQLTIRQRELVDGFAAQLSLVVERERLRAASEREKLLIESERLHRTLLDSVSHELKTPLLVLRSATEKLEAADPGRRGALLEEIRTATRRFERLVANLLNQSRLEGGTIRPSLDWCEVRELIQTARTQAAEAITGREVSVEVPHDFPLFLADAVLMEHVLVNLLLNAAVHTPEAGPIRILAAVDRPQARIEISVIDRGLGIAPELREHLFEKFRRGSNARAGGLGLGLSIVKGFMLAQAGDITVADGPVGGACFTLRLPLSAHGEIPNDES